MAAAAPAALGHHHTYSITYPTSNLKFTALRAGELVCSNTGEVFTYNDDGFLGKGCSGSVFALRTSADESAPYVVKTIRVRTLPGRRSTSVIPTEIQQEITMLSRAGQLYGSTPVINGTVNIIMQRLGNTDGIDFVSDLEGRTLSLLQFLQMAYHFTQAVVQFHDEKVYCHPKAIHRDIKLENFRLQADEVGNVTDAWLVDYGFARVLAPEKSHYLGRVCGTPSSMIWPSEHFETLYKPGLTRGIHKDDLRHKFWDYCNTVNLNHPHSGADKTLFDQLWVKKDNSIYCCTATDAYALATSIQQACDHTLSDEDQKIFQPVLKMFALASNPDAPLPLTWIAQGLEILINDIKLDTPKEAVTDQINALFSRSTQLFLPLSKALQDYRIARDTNDSRAIIVTETKIATIYNGFSAAAGAQPTADSGTMAPRENSGSASASSASATDDALSHHPPKPAASSSALVVFDHDGAAPKSDGHELRCG